MRYIVVTFFVTDNPLISMYFLATYDIKCHFRLFPLLQVIDFAEISSWYEACNINSIFAIKKEGIQMKIVAGNKMSLIVKQEEGKEFEAIVKRISSTSEQPFYGINFVDGKPVGGCTMTAGNVAALVARAKKAGLKIEE